MTDDNAWGGFYRLFNISTVDFLDIQVSLMRLLLLYKTAVALPKRLKVKRRE